MLRHIRRSRKSAGFTLIELAIVFLVSGLLLAGVAKGYDNYRKTEAIEKTRDGMEDISKSVSAFFAQYGYFPCPASFSKGPDDETAGEATDCADQTVLPGTCNADYCVAVRAIDHDNNPGTPDVDMRVRIGSVPFKELSAGISGDDTYDAALVSITNSLDGYRNRYTYAVTEAQALDGYTQGLGAIQIVDENGVSLYDRADFVLLSHGPDKVGAYTVDGVPFGDGCIGTGYDLENCDMDAVFTDALRSDVADASHFDDMLKYRMWTTYFLWDVPDADKDDIYNINDGDVGVGVMDPQAKLHVKDGNLRTDASLYAQEICDDQGNDCFSADLIGGSALPPCDDMEAARGIAYGSLDCEPTIQSNVATGCAPDEYISGFTYHAVTKTMDVTCKNPLPTPPADCVTPWGSNVAHGGTTTAYQSDAVTAPATCTSETRACNNGTLTGSYQFGSCTEGGAQCAGTTLSWMGNCSGVVGTLDDGDGPAVANTNPGYTGSATFTCSNGTWTGPSPGATCNAAPPGTCNLPWGGTINEGQSVTAYQTGSVTTPQTCNGETRTCTGGVLSGGFTFNDCHVNCVAKGKTWLANCSATIPANPHGVGYTAPNVAPGYSGSATYTCNEGSWVGPSGAVCNPAGGSPCNLPWGGSINDGDSVTAYQTASVPFGSTCNSQSRVCTNGSLSGAFTNQNCTVDPPANCTAPWGTPVNHGNSVTAYQTATVPFGSTCNSQSRVCTNGSLSGAFTNQTCTVSPPANCTSPWGTPVNHGNSITAYKFDIVKPSDSCQSETRNCNNGSLSGSFGYQSCRTGNSCWTGDIYEFDHGSYATLRKNPDFCGTTKKCDCTDGSWTNCNGWSDPFLYCDW